MNRNFEHDNWESVNWGGVVNTVCFIKVVDPAEVHTQTTYSLQISRQETQPLVPPTAAAFNKVQVQRINGQFDYDKCSNQMLETLIMEYLFRIFIPNILKD